MKRNMILIIIFFYVFPLSIGLSIYPQERDFPQKNSFKRPYYIYQTDIDFKIDGSLKEWNGIVPFLVLYKPDEEKLSFSNDISVLARFAFDINHFYAALSVKDDVFEFPQRSWRYGDGFYLTFVSNARGKPDSQFYSYGFSKVGDRLEKILVNRDGIYFPPMDMKEVEFAVKIDYQQHAVYYEVAIPWKYVSPFKPLIYKVLGINLIYVDRDGNDRAILQLFPDPHFDTELSDKRRGAPFVFVERIPLNKQLVECQSSISSTHCFSDRKLKVQFAVNAPRAKKDCLVRAAILKGRTVLGKKEYKVDIAAGLNRLSLDLDLKGIETGTYQVRRELLYDQKRTSQLIDKENIFVMDRKWLDTLEDKFRIFNKSARTIEGYQASIPIAEIRCQWIRNFMNTATSHADIKALGHWLKELKQLYDKLERGRPALFDDTGIHRYAHRSKIDNTLQPYSLFIPSALKLDRAYPLLVVLHGSGVDERGMIKYQSKIFSDWLILAPQARGLSDWYVGESGEDVLECIEHVSSLFPIDKENIFLLGFSMGGYGVWRIGLLHPEMFKALVVISGDFRPPAYIKGENMLEFLDKARRKSILIVHGQLDKAVPVVKIQEGINRLKTLGLDFDYWEIENAAHGSFKPEVWQRIEEWIKQKLVH